jgi:ABC-type amino acid transport substrate-binding protein
MKQSDGYNIKEVPKMEQMVRMLVSNRGDIIINSSTSVNWFIHKLGYKNKIKEISIVAPATRFHMTFMVSRKSPWLEKGLVRALDNELKKMKVSGEWLKVLKKYRNPYGAGVPFKSLIKTDDFYSDYYKYLIYKPGK